MGNVAIYGKRDQMRNIKIEQNITISNIELTFYEIRFLDEIWKNLTRL